MLVSPEVTLISPACHNHDVRNKKISDCYYYDSILKRKILLITQLHWLIFDSQDWSSLWQKPQGGSLLVSQTSSERNDDFSKRVTRKYCSTLYVVINYSYLINLSLTHVVGIHTTIYVYLVLQWKNCQIEFLRPHLHANNPYVYVYVYI